MNDSQPARNLTVEPINILIVDDEPKNLTVLETVLDDPGYRLIRAESADKALLALVAQEFALLILDVRMPEMTGFELAQLIKERAKTAHIPIIFLTAYYNQDQHVFEGYGVGAVDYLHKPVNPTILRSKVAVFADQHRRQRALITEVAERRRAEEQLRELNETLDQRVAERTEELRESELRYRDMLDALPAAVYTTDARGRIVHYNTAAVAASGRTPVIGEDDSRIIWKFLKADGSPLDHEDYPMAITLKDGRNLRGQQLIVERPDGSRFWGEIYPTRLSNRAGEVVGGINMIIDITARKQLEESQRNSEVRYRRLFEAAKDGILILDARSGKITDANAFMGRLVGLSVQELLGKELHEIGLFGDPQASQRAISMLQKDDYVRFDHLPVQHQDGQTTDVEVVANTYREGQALVVQCNVRDISQRVIMENRIKAQAEQLAGEAARKDEFLAMLSHELRSPLAPIRAAAHLMRTQGTGVDNPMQKQAREIIERQVANLTKIVNDLLEVSRVASGRIHLERQTVDLNQIVRHAIETVTPIVEQHRHELVLHQCENEIWADADATRLEEVFINLLNNAAKYTPDGGKIEVWCETSLAINGGQQAQFRVRDSGIGIDHELLPRIFDLFTQADRSLARSQGGLGIGLSLAHRLVDMHGGTIEARSDGHGLGAEFIVRLPLIPSPDRSKLKSDLRHKHPARPDELRVLIVDDNMDLVIMLASSLRQVGYLVQSAYTGPDGLKLAQTWKPDVILLDIGLPGLDGYEVARRLRSHPQTKHARIIAVTGYGRDVDKKLALEAGFDDHLTKPVDTNDLEKLMVIPRKWMGAGG